MKKNHKEVYIANLEIVAFSVIKLWYKLEYHKKTYGTRTIIEKILDDHSFL